MGIITYETPNSQITILLFIVNNAKEELFSTRGKTIKGEILDSPLYLFLQG